MNLLIAEIYRHSSKYEKLRLVALGLFLALCLVAGGASRADVIGPTMVRLGAIVLIALSVAALDRDQVKELRIPLLLLACLALLMLCQLVPLPSALWTSLPGRQLYAAVVENAGLQDQWRPLSLTPDLTLNSLLSILPAAAILISVASLPLLARFAMLPLYVIGAFLSALLGLLQVTDATASLYIYQITNEGFPVGFFSNRNHQGLLLAMSIPLFMLWAAPRASGQADPRRLLAALLAMLIIIPMVLITGSRAALMLAIAGIVPAVLQLDTETRRRLRQARHGVTRAYMVAICAAIVMVVFSVFWLSRDQSFSRLVSVDISSDQRYVFIPQMIKMIWDTFPVGFGFGSFETIFRNYEPVSGLTNLYFNHAHNDFIEILIEGGAAAAVLLALFIGWSLKQSLAAWRHKRSSRLAYARLGSIILLMLCVASLVDYPLRTPFFSALAALAVSWLATAGRPTAMKSPMAR